MHRCIKSVLQSASCARRLLFFDYYTERIITLQIAGSPVWPRCGECLWARPDIICRRSHPVYFYSIDHYPPAVVTVFPDRIAVHYAPCTCSRKIVVRSRAFIVQQRSPKTVVPIISWLQSSRFAPC